jgi:hypothetical protein
MHIESIQYHDASISTLILPVKRYTLGGDTSSGLVLFFAHGTGMRESKCFPWLVTFAKYEHTDKEQWEPIIEKLLQIEGVSEAYSFDWPNHGEGALLNAHVLASFEPIGVGSLTISYPQDEMPITISDSHLGLGPSHRWVLQGQ